MFPESKRQIFGPFFNGEKEVFADPLRVYRRLQVQLDGDANKYLEQSRSEDFSLAFHAKERIIPAALFALELVPFDPKTGKGTLEEDCIRVLNAYLEFMDEVKKNSQKQVTYSLPSPASPSPSPAR